MKQQLKQRPLLFGWLFVLVLLVATPAVFLAIKNAQADLPTVQNQSLAVTSFADGDVAATGNTALLALPRQTDGGYAATVTRESAVFHSNFPFNAFGVQWHATTSDQTTITLAVRSDEGSGFGPWTPIPNDEDLAQPTMVDHFSELQFVEHGTAVQVQATLTTQDPQQTPTLDLLTIHFMDSTQGPTTDQITANQIQSSSTAPTVISRSQWGANEGYRNWNPEYATVQKFILHHTAGSSGEPDPAASLRGIYYYHAVTLGWGDIGYNYIVDQRGNIYEGRYGGANVIAAHASGHNVGSLGISLMGNFEVQTSVPAASLTAVEKLIAWKAQQLNIDPKGSSYFVDRNLPNISGHRDVNSTACPGTYYYDDLPAIRNAVADLIAPPPLNEQYKAQITAISQSSITMDKGQRVQVTVKMKNIGTQPWSRDGSDFIALNVTDPKGRTSAFKDSTWNEYPYRPTRLTDSSPVQPGSEGTFTFWLNASAYGTYTETFQAVAEHLTWIEGSKFSLAITVMPAWKGEVSSVAISSGGVSDPSNPTALTIPAGTTASVTIRIKNTGSNTWRPTGDAFVAMNVINPVGRTSAFKASSWNEYAYRPTRIDNDNVRTNDTGIFTFDLTAPQKAGTYNEQFQLVAEHVAWITGTVIALDITVPPAYAAQVTSAPSSLTLEPGERKLVSVTMKNTGSITWSPTSSDFIALNVTDPQGRHSAFYDADWNEYYYRPTRLDTSSVPYGSTGTFSFYLTAPQTNGVYSETFQAVAEHITWINGSKFTIPITVKPKYAAQIVSQSAASLNMDLGTTTTFWIKMKNVGQNTWYNNSSDFVALNVTSPVGRTSAFKNDTWNEFPYRPTRLEEASVAPEATGTFEFTLTAAQVGTFNEAFQAVAEKVAWIGGSTFTLPITVKRPYDAQIVQRSTTNLTIAAGTRAEYWIKMKNTGSQTWYNNSSDFVALNVINPIGRYSGFQDSTWNEYYYRPTRLEEASVAPGATGTFHFYLAAPENMSGSFTESFQAVVEHVAWIPNSNFDIPITVTAPSAGNLGSTVRVGIQSANSFTVKARSGGMVLEKPGGIVLGSFSDGQQVTVTFSNNKYNISGPGLTTSVDFSPSADSVTFRPMVNAFLELASYEDRPGWNPSLNDNTFRGLLSIQYSPATGKTWAINKLPMEYYLHGIGEQSNGTLEEMLKLMSVIERTYAQYNVGRGGKHASEYFDVDNKYDQVYKGYNFELRSPNVAAAVDFTRGQMVTYGGQVALTPYFSSSDGRTRSYDEVWNGYYAYLVSVPDPWCNGEALSGHGVGLSALGALRQAQNEHKPYWDILKYYYTGTGLTDYY